MRFRVIYERREDLQRDLDTQLSRGGIFLNVPPPEGLQYEVSQHLDLIAPDGTTAKSDARVLASMPGQGIALSVPPEAVALLRAALARLTFDTTTANPPRHEIVTGSTPPPTPALGANPTPPPRVPAVPATVARTPPAEAAPTWDSLPPAEKMRLAQHGDRDERAAALRDKNRALAPHVLKNPRITIDEVVAIARNPQSPPDLLKLVADRGDWMGRSQVAEAIARNPKSPNDVGVRALASCSAEALRQMAKGVGAPPHVIQAARKRVIG